jgi:hypothetical protein
MEKDAASDSPIYHWQKTEDGKHTFADLPQDAAHPFLKQRFYLGSSGFVPVQGSPEDYNKQQIFDALATTGSAVPRPRDAQGNFIHFDYNTINKMSPEEQQQYIDYIKDFNLHQKSVDPTDANGVTLANSANAIRDSQRIEDKILWMKENHIPMGVISQSELTRSEEAGWAQAAGSNDPIGWATWYGFSHGMPKNLLADGLRGDYKLLNSHLAGTAGGTYEKTAASPERNDFGINLKPNIPFEFGIPLTTNVSTIPQLNNIGTGDNYDEALAHIREVKGNAINDYRKIVSQLPRNGLRVPADDLKNIADLDNPNKGYLDDHSNRMWDKDHKKLINPYGKEGIPYSPEVGKWTYVGADQATAGASPTPNIPQIAKYDTKEFERLGIKKGDSYLGPDGTPYTRGQ